MIKRNDNNIIILYFVISILIIGLWKIEKLLYNNIFINCEIVKIL